MALNRRGFLQSLIAGAIAASAAPAVLAALSPTTPEVALATPEMNKYEKALLLFDLVIESPKDRILCAARFNRLLEHFRLTFSPAVYDKVTQQEISDMMRSIHKDSAQQEADIRRVPPVLNDTVIIVTMVKLILSSSGYMCEINHRNVSEFHWFHINYGPLILAV